jgi:hypothetical protein
MIKSRRVSWTGHVARMWVIGNIYTILTGKCEGKRSLGSSRRRREHCIKMDLKDIEYEGVSWIHLEEDKNQWRALVHRTSRGFGFVAYTHAMPRHNRVQHNCASRRTVA